VGGVETEQEAEIAQNGIEGKHGNANATLSNASISRNEDAGRGLGNPPALTFREASLSKYLSSKTTTDDDFNSFLIQPDSSNDPDRLLIHYREQLKASWRKSVADILGMGEILTEAKDRLPHGHFKTLAAEVGYGTMYGGTVDGDH
jgi:hypothetical protein